MSNGLGLIFWRIEVESLYFVRDCNLQEERKDPPNVEKYNWSFLIATGSQASCTQSNLFSVKHFQNTVTKETYNLFWIWSNVYTELKEFFKFLAPPQLTKAPPLSPNCTDASAFRPGAQVSNQLIRSPHLVAQPDKSSHYPLYPNWLGCVLEIPNMLDLDWWYCSKETVCRSDCTKWSIECVSGHAVPPQHTRWIHT